jgi:hypothetical protein
VEQARLNGAVIRGLVHPIPERVVSRMTSSGTAEVALAPVRRMHSSSR